MEGDLPPEGVSAAEVEDAEVAGPADEQAAGDQDAGSGGGGGEGAGDQDAGNGGVGGEGNAAPEEDWPALRLEQQSASGPAASALFSTPGRKSPRARLNSHQLQHQQLAGDERARQLLYQRLYGPDVIGDDSPASYQGSPTSTGFSSPGRRKPDPKVMQRLLEKKERKNAPLPVDQYPFRPMTSEKSAKLVSEKGGDGPRWEALANAGPAQAQREENLRHLRDETRAKEMAECTFKPKVSDRSAALVKEAEESGKLKPQRWKSSKSLEGAAEAEDEEGGDSPMDQTLASPQPLKSARGTKQGLAKSTTKYTLSSQQARQPQRPNATTMGQCGRWVSQDPFACRTDRVVKPVDLSDPVFDELHQVLMSLAI